MRSYLGVYDCLGPTQSFGGTPRDPLRLAGTLTAYLSFSHQSPPHKPSLEPLCCAKVPSRSFSSTSGTMVRFTQAQGPADDLENATMPRDRGVWGPNLRISKIELWAPR